MPAPPNSAAGSKEKLILASLAFLLVGSFAACHISTWPARLRYPGELALVEGMRLAEMKHLLQGVPVYAPASPKCFDAMIYGPLYYLVGARLINPERPAYFPLRLLGLLATLGCAAGLALLAFRLSRSSLAAVLAPLLFLSYGFVSLHGVSARCDMVALFLIFSGFLVAHRFRQGPALLLAVPLMLLSFFYKQQFVAAPLGVLGFLVWERRYRLAAQFAGLLALSGLALLALFQYVIFAGQSFFLHFVTYNLVPFTWNRFGYGLLLFSVIFGVPVLLGFESLRQRPDKLISSYLGATALWTVFSLGKEGSGTNYFLETVVVLSPLLAGLVARSTAEPMRTAEVLALLAVSLLAGTRLATLAPRPEDFVRDRALQQYLRRNFVPHTSAPGNFTGDLLRAGLDTPISDFYQYTWLACKGEIRAEEVLAHFRERRFGVMLLGFDLHNEKDAHRPNEICMTEPLHQTILHNYELATTLDMPSPEQGDYPTRFYVWTPRHEGESGRPAASPTRIEGQEHQGTKASP